VRAIFPLILLVLFATTPTAFAQSQFEVGQVYKNFIELKKDGEKMQLALPPGQWEVSAIRHPKPHPNGTKLVLVQLFNGENGMWMGGITFVFYYENYFRGFRAARWCRSTHLNHIEQIALYDGTQTDCWGVSYYGDTAVAKNKAFKESKRYVESKGLAMPVNPVFVKFIRSNYGEFLAVDYIFNPEAHGVPKPENPAKEDSDYHPENIDRYPKKKAFVGSVVTWARNAKKYFDLGFEGKLTENKMEKFDFK